MSNKPAVEDVEGLDDFMNAGAGVMPMVMGISPQDAPRPAFRLEKLPPRTRIKIMMQAQYEEAEDGTKTKLIGFKPVPTEEVVSGGYLVHCMKGHKVAIDSLAQLERMGLSGYVPMLKLSGDKFEGEVVGAVHSQQVTRNARNA